MRFAAVLLILSALMTRASSLAADRPPSEPAKKKSAAEPSAAIAFVPDSLAKTAAYSDYAKTLVQLDLLAKSQTAGLRIDVEIIEPGLLALVGKTPNDRLRRQLLVDARRISGLMVRDQLASGPAVQDTFSTASPEELEEQTRDTLRELFPELLENISASGEAGGVVRLRGEVPSYESKLMLSRAIKSQPGCRAVVNLTEIRVDPSTGRVAIGGDQWLDPGALPTVPPAPIADFGDDEKHASVRQMTARVSGDDALDKNLRDRQLRDDVEAQIGGVTQLANIDMVVEAYGDEVTISGKITKRELVEQAAAAAAAVPGAVNVVVKGQPFTIRRHTPERLRDKGPSSVYQPKRIFGLIPSPFDSGDQDPDSPASTRRFREMVRRSLKKRASGRIKALDVRQSLSAGLVIEGEVETNRDRAFILGQLDEIAELRGVRYDVILRVTGDK